MAAPTYVQTTQSNNPVTWGFNDASATRATPSYSPTAGTILVGVAASADAAANPLTSISGGPTWTQQYLDNTASYCGAALYTATATGGAITSTVTGTPNANRQFGLAVLQFTASDGIGAKATAKAASVTLTTTQANSAIVAIIADWAAVTGTSTWASISGSTPVEVADYADGTNYGVHVAYWPDVGAAGAKTVQMTAPSGMTPTLLAIEVKGTSGGGSTVSGAGTSLGGSAAQANGAATSARSAVATALAYAAGAGASTVARAGASLARADVVGSVLGVTAKSAISVGSGVAAAVRASIAAGNGASLGAGIAAATFSATAARSGVALGSAPSIGSVYARLLLEWDDAGADEGYRIQWGYSSGVYAGSADVATDVLQYLLTELPLDTNIYWRVAALVGGSPQDWSAEKVARTTYYFCTARGFSTAYATGAAIFARAGASASSGFAVGNYAAINVAAAAGASPGSASAAAVGASTFSAIGVSLGAAPANAAGASTVARTGASLGAARASAVGASTAAVSGVSMGGAFATGSYAVGNVQSAYGSALGGGYVAGDGRSTAAAVGSSLGQSANTGAGGATVARAGSAVAWAFAVGDYSASNIQARAAVALSCGFACASAISTAEASGAAFGWSAARAAGTSITAASTEGNHVIIRRRPPPHVERSRPDDWWCINLPMRRQ